MLHISDQTDHNIINSLLVTLYIEGSDYNFTNYNYNTTLDLLKRTFNKSLARGGDIILLFVELIVSGLVVNSPYEL